MLFDAAETLFTTRGSVGEIYASVARKYGSQASPQDIQAAFLQNFRGAGPVSAGEQKHWWHDIVQRVFQQVGMFDNFDRFFDEVYDRFRGSQGWALFPRPFRFSKNCASAASSWESFPTSTAAFIL